jgi:hypothetical protein
MSLQKAEEVGFTRLPHSHDLAPCGFFLFGYLKKEREEKNFRSENEVISALRTILEAIPI